MNEIQLERESAYVSVVKYASDAVLTVEFFDRCKENERGEPVGNPMLFISIEEPRMGAREPDCVVRPATNEDVQRFPAKFQEYKAKKEGRSIPDYVQGTPLADVSGFDRVAITTCARHGLKYAEQLAVANSYTLTCLGPYGHVWQNLAKKHLTENGTKAALREAVAKEVTPDIERMAKIIEEQGALIERLMKQDGGAANEVSPKKRGRPRKVNDGDATTDNQ